MNGIVHTVARLVLAAHKAWTRKWIFLVLVVAVFFVSVVTLAKLDLLPNPPKTESVEAAGTPIVTLDASPLVSAATTTTSVTVAAPSTTHPSASQTVAVSGELPVKIVIPAISLSATVANPNTTNIETLDEYLLSGAVRYPTSATLGATNGNVVIFGHSSYLPIVHNQAFKTFDGIQKLHAGDTVTVYSADAVYTYAVETVVKANAGSDAIPLTVSGSKLTLATCDSFGTKSDRFVVTATLVESHLIAE